MGNQLGTARGADVMSELPKVDSEGEALVFGRVLGGGRFLKTLQCWHDTQMVVVKAYSKRDAAQSLREYAERLEGIRERLSGLDHPNVLPFMWFPETPRAAFLVRAFVHSSLKERVTMRPFLTTLERRWITFQLLTALEQCQSVGLVHGDIKSNNMLITSWNWVVLSDLTGLKPGYLPEDNPADLSYFFDDDYHKRCYVAPERFYHSSTPEAQRPKEMMTGAIDVFASGCVIAELFLSGEAPFSLAELLAYRKGQYDAAHRLRQIADADIAELVGDMIALDPAQRGLPGEYLKRYQSRCFPLYFGKFLHGFTWRCMNELTPDETIATLWRQRDAILAALGVPHAEGARRLPAVDARFAGSISSSSSASSKSGSDDEEQDLAVLCSDVLLGVADGVPAEGVGGAKQDCKGVKEAGEEDGRKGQERGVMCEDLVNILVMVTSVMRSVKVLYLFVRQCM